MMDCVYMLEMFIEGVFCYEEVLDGYLSQIDWLDFLEDIVVGFCYIFGMIGNLKGIFYFYRLIVLYVYSVCVILLKVLQEGIWILFVVLLFYVNVWGLFYVVFLFGVSLIFLGGVLDGMFLFDLMECEKVFLVWGVFMVWFGLMNEVIVCGCLLGGFGDIVVGGFVVLCFLIEGFEKMGVNVCYVWGMIEMSLIGIQGNLLLSMDDWNFDKWIDCK